MRQIARERGMSERAIAYWCKHAQTQEGAAFPGSGQQTALEEENRRLKRERALAQQEREMLKKPLGIFSRGNPLSDRWRLVNWQPPIQYAVGNGSSDCCANVRFPPSATVTGGERRIASTRARWLPRIWLVSFLRNGPMNRGGR